MQVPVKAREQLPHVVRFDPGEIRKAVREVEGFNAKLALVITRSVGTMACAYLFAAIALISLPAAITLRAGDRHRGLDRADVPAAGAPVDHHGRADGAIRGLGRACRKGVR